MKTILKLLLLLIVAVAAYFVFGPSEHKEEMAKNIPFLQPTDPATGKPLVDCPRCAGTGHTKCTEPFCKEGQVDCPGPCLKLSRGVWERREVAGQPSGQLWISVPAGSKQLFSEAYVGQVIEYRRGKSVSTGPCQECNGRAKVACKVCDGTAQIACASCKGQKSVPDLRPASNTTSTAGSAPKAAATPPPLAPETVMLKNGESIVGNIVIRDADIVIIRTPDGKTTQVATKDLAPR